MSSYIAFDLDALNMVPDVANASGLPAGDVAHGLLKLWAYCFRNKTDAVTEVHLSGFFGKPASAALSAFGFLEAGNATWRVKGAERYLRIADGRRRGGLASKSNLVPGGRKPAETVARVEPRSSREAAETDARLDLGLSPSTEHRAPNTEHRKDIAPKKPAPRESDRLLADFLEIIKSPYLFGGEKDGVAWAALRKTADIDEISRRWRIGLAQSGYLGVRTIAELRSKWNSLAQASLPTAANPRAPAPVADWTNATHGEIPA